jgi:hypothetical protein
MQTIIFTPPTFSLFPVSHDVNKIVTWADKLSLYSRFTNEKNPETRTWSGFFSWQQGFWQGEWGHVYRCLLLGLGSRAWVNAFILFSTKVQLISIFSYWIPNLGNHHHRWVGVDNVHIPCKYIILTNLICFYCYLVDRYGKSMSQMTNIFLIHLS